MEPKRRGSRLGVEEVGGHQELESNLGLDGELGDLARHVGVLELVVKVLDDLFEYPC